MALATPLTVVSLAARSASTMRSSSSLGSRWVRRFPRSILPGSTIRATTSTVSSAAAARHRGQSADLHRAVRQRRVGFDSRWKILRPTIRAICINLGAGRRLQRVPPSLVAAYGTNALGGTRAPDIIGVLKVDQAWGVFQLSADAHNNHAAYYGGTETTGHPADKWGWAVQAGLQIKNIPTGAGDTINLQAVYTDGTFSSQLPELGWAELRDVRRHQLAGRLPERWPRGRR